MASSTECDCHKDPNFAVICSFLDKYGEFLGLPQVSYSDLERYLQDNTNNVSRVLIDIHVRLLRRIGKSSVSSDRFEKSIIKFCHHFSEFDAWEVESYGYKHANVKTKLRILKNLLECQFDYNIKFKEKVNESSAEEMRFLPIGRDKEGQAYWYFLDNDLNLLIYKEEQDDEDADTWQLVCSDRQQLAKLVDTLKDDAVKEVKEEEDKTSTESRSSKEGSPDKEVTSKEGNEDVKSEDAQTLKKEPDLVVKEEPVERDKNKGSSVESAVKINAVESDSKDRKKGDRKGAGKNVKEKEMKLVGKVELNVSIKRLSEQSMEKYKRRKEDDASKSEVKIEPTPLSTAEQEPECSKTDQTAEDKDKDTDEKSRADVSETDVPSGSEGKQLVSEKSADDSKKSGAVETESEKGSRETVGLLNVSDKDIEISREAEPSEEQKKATADVSITDKKEEGAGSEQTSGVDKIESFSKEKQETASDKVHEESLSEEMKENPGLDNNNQEETKSPRPDTKLSKVESEKPENVSTEKDTASCSYSDGTVGRSEASLPGEAKEDDNQIEADEKVLSPDDGREAKVDSKETQERSKQVDNEDGSTPEARAEDTMEKLIDSVDEAAKNVPLLQAGNTPVEDFAEKSKEESHASPQDKGTTTSASDSSLCPEKRNDSKAENVSEKENEPVEDVEKLSEKEEKQTSKEEPTPENVVASSSSDKNLDENPAQSELHKDPDKDETVNNDMSKEECMETKSAPEISDAEEDFTELGDADDDVDEIPVSQEKATGKENEHDKEKAAIPSTEGDETVHTLAESDTKSPEKSDSHLQETADSEELGHKGVSDQIIHSAEKSEKDTEVSENVQAKTEDSPSSVLSTVVEESKECVTDVEKTESKHEEKDGNLSSQMVPQANNSTAAEDVIAGDEKENVKEKDPNAENLSKESDATNSSPVQKNNSENDQKADETKQKQNDQGSETEPEEKTKEVQSFDGTSQPSKTSVHIPEEDKPSKETPSVEKLSELKAEAEKPMSEVEKPTSEAEKPTSEAEILGGKSALTNGPGEEEKEKDLSVESSEDKPSQSSDKNDKEVVNGLTENTAVSGASTASGTVVSEALQSSEEKVQDLSSIKSENKKAEQKETTEKTLEPSGEQKEDGQPPGDSTKGSEEVKESKSDCVADTKEKFCEEEKKSEGEGAKSDCVDEGQEGGDKSNSGQIENAVERDEQGEERKAKEDKVECYDVEKEGEKKGVAEKDKTEDVKKQEKEEDKKLEAESVDNVEKDEEKEPKAQSAPKPEEKKEASNVSEKKEDDENKNPEQQVQKAGEEGKVKKATEDSKRNETDTKSDKSAQSPKKTRGSETQRNLKRAAPEPASDEVIESEPNGKRARPTARVVKTRGGRNAAARGRASRLANKESESEDSESVAPAAKSKRGVGRGRGRGGRGRGASRNSSATKIQTDAKKASEENDEDGSDQATGKRAKKKKPDSSSEVLSEEEVTPAKKGRNQIQSKTPTRGAAVSRGSHRGGRGRGRGAAAKKAGQPSTPAQKDEDGSRRRSARVKEMKAKRPPTPSSPEEESEPTEEEEEDEEDFEPGKFFLEGSFTPEEESGDEEFKPKGRNFQRQAARIQEKNEDVVNDDTPCLKCGKYNHPEMILLCDKCDAGYHTACLRPPLMVIPDGDWFCPPCEHSMLVERLFACLQSLDIALKKKDRLSKRQERLAYVGISINNILHGDRPVHVSDKFDGKQGSVKDEEEGEEEEEEEAASEASSSYESEEEVPERKFRSERLAMRQAEKRSRREKHKRRKTSRAQSPDSEVFAKRTCRTRNAVSYQFKEFDELISNAIDDDQPVRKEKPPGRSRGKDMSNILGASDEEDEKIRKRDQETGAELPIPVVRKKPKRRLTRLDSDEEEEVDDDSEEFKLSEDDDSDATEVEDADDGDGDEDELTEENSDSGDWKPKKTWYNSRNNRSNRRRKFVVDEDDYDSDENASKRRSTRNSTRGRVTYDDWDSEEETEAETEEEEESSFSDFSSDDSRFARKMKKEKEKRLQKAAGKDGRDKSKRKGDEEESEGSVSDSSMVRKRKMLMKLVKKRRKDESGNEDTEEAEVSKNRIRTHKAKRKTFSEDSSASFDEEEESGSDESDQPRSKKKNVLRSSDEDEVEKPTNGETVASDQKTEVLENSKASGVEASEPKVTEEPQPKGPGKRGSPSKAQTPVKGKKRGEGLDLKSEEGAENKDEPIPGKVRRLSGSDKEGALEPNPPLETPALQKKVQPARRGRAASKEGQGEVLPEKKVPAVGNRRSSTDKQTRSGKKKRLPNFLNVPSGGESDEGEVKPPAAADAMSKPDQPVPSAQAMPLGVQQPATRPAFPPQPHQGPQLHGYQPNQHPGGPQAQQFNPAFPSGQVGAAHLRPGLSSPPHSMANVTSGTAHDNSSSTAQVPPHYSAPPGHPGATGLAAATMRGPYPKYNGVPASQMPQGMPPHMMNQTLEPGQIPPMNMTHPPHVRLPSQPMAQPPPHSMGHDQPHPGMMQQQQWADHRAPGPQPPGYGNAPRMSYPREMVPRQPYYHMRSPPPHHMGQYPPHMGSPANNPLTSMGQMTRNLSPGMKSPPPRPAGEAGGEEGKAAASQDMPMKQEVKQEAHEKGRDADTASPEKGAVKVSGKRAKASSPKSHSEKPEGEESGTNNASQAQPGSTPPSQSSQPSQIAPPISSSSMPYQQQHPYMNSQQGFYMPQHYRMPYGGPNQGPMNQMQGVPPYHNQYMNPNQPFPVPQGHRPYLPPGQPPQMTSLPPNPLSGQNPPPPSSMPNQQSQSNIGPPQSMPSGMPANPNIPLNQQRPPPPMNASQQAQHGTPDPAMMPPASYQQRPPGMAPNQVGAPGFMPNYTVPSPMPHPGMPPVAHGMQPTPQMGPQGAPQNQTGPQQGVQAAPANKPSPLRMPQAQPPQGSVGMAPNQQPPVSMPSHPQGNVSNVPASGQGEPPSGQVPHMPGPQMMPYYQMQPGQQQQAGAPTLPPPESGAQQQAQNKAGNTMTEPKRSGSPPSGNQKAPETDNPQEPKTTSETHVKEEPKAAPQEAQPPKHAFPQGDTKPPPAGGTNAPNAAGSNNMPVSRSNDPVAMPNANSRNLPPTSMGQGHPHQSGQGPPMPYYNPGPYFQPYASNMPPQGEHMHSQARWGPNMPPYGPRFGGHPYPPYGMGPEAMNMMPGQGMHGNAGPPLHPQGAPSGGPMGLPPNTAVPSTPPHPGTQQDFQAPRDQPAAVRNRRSSSTDSRSNLPPASTHSEAPSETPVSSSSHPQSSPSVSSPSTSMKSEQLPTVSSPSLPPSSSSSSSSSTSATTTTVSASPVAQQAPIPSSSPKSMPSKSENKDFPPEPSVPPMSIAGPPSTWSGPNMNHQYSHAMGQMHRMGAPGLYNVMPPYNPQGMMPPQPHNFYMMGPNPRQANSKGPGQANFHQYPGHLPPQAHGMNPMLGMNQPPMAYNGGYRPPSYMPQGQEHPAMPPRPDFKSEMQSAPNPPSEMGSSLQNPPPDSHPSDGNAVAPKAKKAKTQKKKEPGAAPSPRGKGNRGRGRGRGGFMIDSLLQARGAGTGEEEGEETGEMKDIVNYVTTDEYIKQQTSS